MNKSKQYVPYFNNFENSNKNDNYNNIIYVLFIVM